MYHGGWVYLGKKKKSGKQKKMVYQYAALRIYLTRVSRAMSFIFVVYALDLIVKV
jgi:hypothetical protein